jgi:hypothetical protein
VTDSSPARWAFVRHRTDNGASWVWQSFGPDGRLLRTSEAFITYGKAMVDALNNGFKPASDDYSVDLPHGRMHFPPGRDPEYSSMRLRMESQSVQRGAIPIRWTAGK